MANLIPLSVQGTPYQAGQQLGRFGAQAVHAHLLGSPAWRHLQQWRGAPQLQEMAGLTQRHFPAIWEELTGLADGLALPLDDVFLWNCRGDLWAMAPDGCTTVLLPANPLAGADGSAPGAARAQAGNPAQPDGVSAASSAALTDDAAGAGRLTHNEDGDPGFAGHCGLLQARIQGSPAFASFVYPGSLPGHTFAATEYGIAMTVNNIRSLASGPGVPRMVLTRALLDVRRIGQAVDLLQSLPRAGAFHLSMASIDDASLWSIEFGHAFCSAMPAHRPMLHANHAIHEQTRNYPQRITGSSGLRQVRGDWLLSQAAQAGQAVDPLSVLGDTHDARYPIRRQAPDDPDHENTLATADFHVSRRHIDWQVYLDPRQTAAFRLRNGALLPADAAQRADAEHTDAVHAGVAHARAAGARADD